MLDSDLIRALVGDIKYNNRPEKSVFRERQEISFGIILIGNGFNRLWALSFGSGASHLIASKFMQKLTATADKPTLWGQLALYCVMEDKENALTLMEKMSAIDLAQFQSEHPEVLDVVEEWMLDLEAVTLFEVACLWAVTGTPPYITAKESFGLDTEKISAYQKQWRDVGIDPKTVEYPFPLMDEE